MNSPCVVYSLAMKNHPMTFKADRTLTKGQPEWGNYVKGVIFQYLDELPSEGASFNAVVASNVPLGSGLSSSAALEFAIIVIFLQFCLMSCFVELLLPPCSRICMHFPQTE